MALDGLFLYTIREELAELVGSRVEKINQPSKDELIVALRSKEGSRRVLISANPSSPRIHLTNEKLENPKAPPMFCMLLRKHLSSGKLLDVTQNGLDRILNLRFQAINELGDPVVLTLVVEIMGRQSNIILVGQDGKIIDAIKRVTSEQSSARVVLPSGRYTLPPVRERLSILEASREEICTRFRETPGVDSAKALIACLEGLSPLLAREIVSRAQNGVDIEKNNLSDFYVGKIADECLRLKAELLSATRQYESIVCDEKKIREFSFTSITQYGKLQKELYPSASALLDSFYAKRDRDARMKQRSHDLLKLLLNNTERVAKKLSLQEGELKTCTERESLRMMGDIINANLYSLQKGQKSAELANFYKEGSPLETIKLDARLSPAQNAQKYYTEYRKAATAEKMLVELLAKGKEELLYLDSVFDAVSRAQSNAELDEIREELATQGYLRLAKKKGGKPKEQPPLRYCSSDSFTILVGRNNRQNDKLTLKIAHNYDMWLHTQGIPGSHVILVSDKREITDTALFEAATIAAFHSKGQDSQNVAVDYTLVKYVKKPAGAKPGMVIFTDYKTLFVTPDEALVTKLSAEVDKTANKGV